jgi:hypothetical protein
VVLELASDQAPGGGTRVPSSRPLDPHPLPSSLFLRVGTLIINNITKLYK